MLDGGIAAAAKHHSFLDAHCQLFFLYLFLSFSLKFTS